MIDTEYLQEVLKSQTFDTDSRELKELRSHREKVEALLDFCTLKTESPKRKNEPLSPAYPWSGATQKYTALG